MKKPERRTCEQNAIVWSDETFVPRLILLR